MLIKRCALIMIGWAVILSSSLSAQPADFTEVAEKAIPAVVAVKTTFKYNAPQGARLFDPFDGFDDSLMERFFGFRRRLEEPQQLPQQQGQGSGFIISQDGYIITNGHVVRDADLIEVQLESGRQYDAKLIGIDPSTDIALIKVEANNLPYLELDDSSKLKVGEWVVAIGNPLGLRVSLTAGVVSGVGRNNLDLAALEDFIQTDAAINRGNSGGPLLNIRGKVVGMNTAIASSSGGNMGIGFAIPSNLISFVIEQLKSSGSVKRGYIGVIIQPIDHDLAMALGLNRVEGALVAEVQEDSPAQEAGLKRGDIVTDVNGIKVNNAGSLRNIVSTFEPGKRLTLNLLRDKHPMAIQVKVGNHPENAVGDQIQGSGKNQLGVTVKELTPEMAERLGFSGERGVVIEEVDPQGPASFVGLKKGTLILEVNREPVTTKQKFNQVLSKLEKEGRVLLLVRQGNMTRYIAFQIR